MAEIRERTISSLTASDLMQMSEALYHGEVRNYIKKLRRQQIGFSNHLAKLT